MRHGSHTFSGVRVSQSLIFCVMVGRLLVGFVWLKLQFSVSWQVYFQWGSCGSIFIFLCHGWQTFSGVREAQSLVFWVKVGNFQWGSCGSIFTFLSHGWQTFVGSCGSIFSFLCHDWWTFSGVRVAQSLLFCVMVGRLLVGFVCLNLQFSVSWLVDFQWASCVSIFRFLCHGRYTFSGVRVAQSFVFCVMVGRLLGGFVWLNLQFSVSWLVDFQWVRVAQSLLFCVMVGRLLVGFVWLNLQFYVAWLVDFQWASCVSIFSFLCHGWQTFSGVRVALQTFNGVCVSQSLVFCVMVGRLLVGFVWLYIQFSVLWQVDFQWGSCGSIFRFLCHVRQTFRGFRVAQSLVFCVMVGRLLVGFVWPQSLVFCVMVGRLLVGFVWLNLQFSVSWLVDFQWGSCGSIFSFLCHGRQTFSGVRVAQSLVLCHGRQTFSRFRVAQSLDFCVMVGRLLVGFVWLKLQFSVSWQVDIQWSSCGSIFCFLRHGWQTCSGVRVAQSLVFCVMVGRLLVGFVWLNLQFSVSWFAYFQWGSCVSIFSFLRHGWQTFSGVRVAQSLVFCVMVGRLSVGFVWLNLLFSVSWLVDLQWGS